ncbi:MAG: MBOAT family O-acyltransferase [Myxococcota bacterium]
MIGVDDWRFWAVVAALTVAVRAGLRPSWRPALFLAATAFLFHERAGWPIAACLLGVATYGYLALAFTPSRGRAASVGIAVHTVAMAALFVGSQYATAVVPGVPVIERIMPLVGLPYLFLRFVHLLVEVVGGRLARPGFVTYLAYLLPFHQLLAGPIQRYTGGGADGQAFADQVLTAPIGPLTTDDLLRAVGRITDGFVKKTILAQLLLDVVGFRFESSGLWAVLEMDLFAIWLYLDFSGYMDIVIGAGMLVGWRPPENFDWPYLSRNIIEFWTRWHITLSEWIRDHVFGPLNLALQRGWLRGRPLAAGMVCYFVSMIAVGLWHRANVQFLLYGLLQGSAIVACKLYEQQLKQRLGKAGLKRYQASTAIRVVATVVNFHYVAFGHVVAFHTPAQVLGILGSIVGVGR